MPVRRPSCRWKTALRPWTSPRSRRSRRLRRTSTPCPRRSPTRPPPRPSPCPPASSLAWSASPAPPSPVVATSNDTDVPSGDGMCDLRPALAALAITLAAAHTAEAIVFNPDGRRPVSYDDEFEYHADLSPQPWEGEVLASQITPFEIRVPTEQPGREVWVRGSLTHEVIRETESGYLSFHYRVGTTGGSGDFRDFEGIALSDFGTYFTDFRADVPMNVTGVIDRTDGGRRFFYRLGESSSQWLIVRTDAPHFAEGGSFDYYVDWDGWDLDGSARLATFMPVPEPGVGALVLFSGAVRLLRRTRRA